MQVSCNRPSLSFQAWTQDASRFCVPWIRTIGARPKKLSLKDRVYTVAFIITTISIFLIALQDHVTFGLSWNLTYTYATIYALQLNGSS